MMPEQEINVIATSHTISTAENGAVIYARIKNPTNACFETRSFALRIVDSPTISTIPSDNPCTRNASEAPLKADFNLTAPINAVLGSQDRSYNILTFHSTEAGANNNTAL
jgi:hypothetical protein